MSALPKPAENAIAQGRALLDFLRDRRTQLSPLLILTHDFPDPDALAAAFGLQYLAQTAFGIDSRIAYRGELGRTENKAMVRLLRIPLHRFRPAWLSRHAGAVLVDTQPAFSNNPFPPNRRATLILDQHPATTPPDADLALVDPGCGATCVLVAQALLQSCADIPTRIATALAYGILTDTLDLYRARRQDVVDTYLEVLHHSDMRLLARIQNPPRPRHFFASLAKGISDARLHRHVIVTHLGDLDTPDRVAQVAEFLLTYRRSRWVLTTGRHKGRLHASLRAAALDADAGPVLRDAFPSPTNAGGHGPIAGGSCRVPKDAPAPGGEAWERELTARVLRRLRIPSRTEARRPFSH